MHNMMRVFTDTTITEEYYNAVIEGAARLLSEDGIGCTSSRAKVFLSENLNGVRYTEDKVYFSRELIYTFLEELKQNFRKCNPLEKPLDHGESWSCLNYYDGETDQIRPAKEEDLIRILRFLDAYGVKGKVPPVALSEFPASLRDLHSTRICLENSPVYGAPTHTPEAEEAQIYADMAQVVNRRMWVLAMLVINPMKFDDKVLDFVIDQRFNPHFDIEMVSGLPSPGSTSPLVFPAVHIQGMAEDLASSLFMKASMNIYEPAYLRGDPFDMRYANYAIAGPEYIMLDMANRKLYEWMSGSPRWWGYLLTMSKKPDVQAAHERTISCWLQALNGATYFKGSGQMASDEVYSMEQVVIDRAIVRNVDRLRTGLTPKMDVDESLELIREGLSEGNYLAHDSTLSEFRDFFTDNPLFPASNLGQWREKGEPSILDKAGEEIRRQCEKTPFARSKEDIRELRDICRRGESVILKNSR